MEIIVNMFVLVCVIAAICNIGKDALTRNDTKEDLQS